MENGDFVVPDEAVSVINKDTIIKLSERACKLPQCPGVYQMYDRHGKIIYIGKAKNLKRRVSSYFRGTHDSAKTAKMVSKVAKFEFIAMDTELDALILEADMIRLHKPKYNILLKDNSGFSYVRITEEDYPRFRLSFNRRDDDSKTDNIGPYAHEYTARRFVDEVNEVFKLPVCMLVFPRDMKKSRPCLNHSIGRCMGVCTGRITVAEYREVVKSALEYIDNGAQKSLEIMTEKMNAYSKRQEFEKAAIMRDKIKSITKVTVRQKVESKDKKPFDIFAVVRGSKNGKRRDNTKGGGIMSIAVVRYRGGILESKDNYFINFSEAAAETVETALSEFIRQYYSACAIPPRIDSNLTPEGADLLSSYLTLRNGGTAVKIHVPKSGEHLVLVTTAKSNAAEYLAMCTGQEGQTAAELVALEKLAETLRLTRLPEIIESYDISNYGKDTPMGGMIVFKYGKPYKNGYRRFKIRGAVQDDYSSIREVVRRRFNRYVSGDKAFADLPDIILVDGGKGHVSAVKTALTEFADKISDADMPAVFGLVKDGKHRTSGLIREREKSADIAAGVSTAAYERIKLDTDNNRELYEFLTAVQDEVHRFTIDSMRYSHIKSGCTADKKSVRSIKGGKSWKIA